MDETLWFVYIIRCNDESLYCGVTNNVAKRIATHNRGKGSKYTCRRLPVELVYFETWSSKSLAYSREYDVKRLPRAEKLKLIYRPVGDATKTVRQ